MIQKWNLIALLSSSQFAIALGPRLLVLGNVQKLAQAIAYNFEFTWDLFRASNILT